MARRRLPQGGLQMKSKHEEHALAISAWEAAGGAPNRSGQLDQYGRRFAGDGTYTISITSSPERQQR